MNMVREMEMRMGHAIATKAMEQVNISDHVHHLTFCHCVFFFSFVCGAVAFQKKQFETFIHNMERDHPIWFLLVHFHLNYLVTGAYVICRERWWPLYASLLSSSDSSSANTTPGHSCLRHSDLQQPAERNRTTSLQQKEKEKKTACQENRLDTHHCLKEKE